MRRRVVLVGLLLLAGCKPAAEAGERVGAVAQARNNMLLAEARAYMAALRVSLVVAAVENRGQTLTLTSCDDPRIGVIPPPKHLKVERCRIELKSEDNYTAAINFDRGLAFVVNQDGVRQVKPSQRPESK